MFHFKREKNSNQVKVIYIVNLLAELFFSGTLMITISKGVIPAFKTWLFAF